MPSTTKKLLLSLVTIGAIIGCGSNTNSSKSDQSSESSQPTITIKSPQKYAKAQLGVLSGATVQIYELGTTPYKLLFTETTSDGTSVDEIGNFNAHASELDADKFYLYKVSGGLDMDADDDGQVDAIPRVNQGTFHAIVKGQSAKKVEGEFKVTAASELLYKKVKDDLNDTASLEEHLNRSAKMILRTDIDKDTQITNEDILQYNPIKHQQEMQESYQEEMPQVIKNIHEDTKVEAENLPPHADAGLDKSITLGNAVELRASGLDLDGEIVKYEWQEDGEVLSQEKHFTYRPDSVGVHTLTLTVTDDDGLKDSDRVTLTVLKKPNSAPTVQSDTYTIDEDTQKDIILKADDSDNDMVTYKILVPPTYGRLEGTPPHITYRPQANFNGADRFIYVANDGKSDSNKGYIVIKVKPSNDKPTIIDDTTEITTQEDHAKRFTIRATDEESDKLTYLITKKPLHGTLTHKKGVFTYTPHKDYNGQDHFTIKVNDGQVDSDEREMSVTVTPVNDAPTVDAGDTKSTIVDTAVSIQANAKDIDGKVVSYKWYEDKRILGSSRTLSYKPTSEGTHTLTVVVTDDKGATATDRVQITATQQPNTKPVAQSQTVQMDEDTTKSITLKANDDDNDKLTYKIVSKPKHGLLSGRPPQVTYRPNKDYFGSDSFSFRVSDGKDDSNVASVKLSIKDIPEPDKTAPVITLNGSAILTLTQGDAYHEAGATAKDDRDGAVKVTTSGTVDSNKVGTYTITYTAVDKAGNRATKTRTVKVIALAYTYKVETALVGNKLTVKWSGFPSGYHSIRLSRPSSSHGYSVKGSSGEKEYVLDRAEYKTYHYTFKMYTTRDLNKKAVYTKEFDVKPLKVDKTPPVIRLSGKSVVTLYLGLGEKYVERGTGSYKTIGGKRTYLASDNVDGSVDVVISGEVNDSKLGTYIITYTATDKSGNKATKTRTVKVIRSAAPVITLKGESTITMYQGEEFNYRATYPTATDDRDSSVRIERSGSVDTSKAGTYILTYTAVDSEGNKASKSITVHVLKSEYNVSYAFDQQNIIINWDSFPRASHTIVVTYKITYRDGTSKVRTATALTLGKAVGSKSLHLYTHNVDATITVYDRLKKVISTQKIKIPSEESLSPLPKITFSGKSGEDAIEIKVGDTVHHPKPTAYSKKYGTIPVKIVRFSQLYRDVEFSTKDTFVVTSDMAKSGGILIVNYEATDKDGNTGKAYVVYHVAKEIVVKPDTKKPVITIKGNFKSKDPQGHLQNFYPRQVITGTYHEDGAEATDDRDGKVAVRISYGKLTKSLFRAGKPASGQGVYVVFYTAKDKAGNKTVKYKLVLKDLAAWYPSPDYEAEVGKYIKAHFDEF